MKYIERSTAQNDLMKIRRSNEDSCHFEFYTDGSLINQGTMNSNMTCGFIQVRDRAPYSKFTTNIKLWPSSAKGELIAIILALLTVPDRSDVIIQTDSENTLNRFYNLQKLNFVLTP